MVKIHTPAHFAACSIVCGPDQIAIPINAVAMVHDSTSDSANDRPKPISFRGFMIPPSAGGSSMRAMEARIDEAHSLTVHAVAAVHNREKRGRQLMRGTQRNERGADEWKRS